MTFESRQTFLSLVRLGIGNSCDFSGAVDWQAIHALADKQGLMAVIVDGIEQLPEKKRPPKVLLLQWIGEVLQGYEKCYGLYRRAVAELAGWYNANGYKMMVLKGYACSIEWPKPEHRPCGDIDIWLFGQQKEADSLLAKAKSLKVDASHHHHTIFDWHGFAVENHYDFVNVHTHRSSAELEKIFKKLGEDDCHSVEVLDEKVYLPSPNLHALFLIRHMVSHFAAAEIALRQVLDWAFFVEKHTDEVDWDWLLSLLEKYHMKDFFALINAICFEDLGFDVRLFPTVRFDPALKDKVLADILEPDFPSSEPNGFVKRMVYKFRRWQGNAWKQKMCYRESRIETFFTGLWSHIITPKMS